MSPNPYENEPGFENANNPQDRKNQQAYVQKVRLSAQQTIPGLTLVE